MQGAPQLILVGTVAVVGILHTLVPDHWLPIAVLARQHGWTRGETFRASLKAASGHVLTTLLIALVIWIAGLAFANRFGRIVDLASSISLIAFGLWIAGSAWLELRGHRGHGHAHVHNHSHENVSEGKKPHRHEDAREVPGASGKRTALLLILGSSPMVESIPVFFAAGKYGFGLVTAMAIVLAASTIATYVILCVYSTEGLRSLKLGKIERFGEVLSGALVALVGFAFLIWPIF